MKSKEAAIISLSSCEKVCLSDKVTNNELSNSNRNILRIVSQLITVGNEANVERIF